MNWTPQEQIGLVAPVFGKSLEEVSDALIIIIDKDGMMSQSYSIEGSAHQGSAKERACRLLYIANSLLLSAMQVMGELHEEIHSE